jgi:hypothetical protein
MARILCLDFDGVLHSYTSGWQGPAVIPDPPVPGFARFLLQAVEHFQVHVFGSRSAFPDGREAMRDWLWRHLHQEPELDGATANHLMKRIQFPSRKPAAFVSLDDRAVRFDGAWPDVAELAAFKTWQQR